MATQYIVDENYQIVEKAPNIYQDELGELIDKVITALEARKISNLQASYLLGHLIQNAVAKEVVAGLVHKPSSRPLQSLTLNLKRRHG